MLTLSRFADRGGAPRRSPIEIVATMGSYLTRTQAAEVSGLRAGPFGCSLRTVSRPKTTGEPLSRKARLDA